MNKNFKRVCVSLFIIAIVAIIAFTFTSCKSEKDKTVVRETGGTGVLLSAITGHNDSSQEYKYIVDYANCPNGIGNNKKFYSDEIEEEGAYISLVSPGDYTSNGTKYVFDGWYKESELYNPIETVTFGDLKTTIARPENPSESVNGIRVYAKWLEYASYTVTYVLNYDETSIGTNDIRNVSSFVGDETYTLYDPTPPADTGSAYFTFEGWYTTSNFASDSQAGKIDATLDTSGNHQITLYAHFVATNYYKVTLNVKGNINNSTQINITSTTHTLYQDGDDYYVKMSSGDTIDLTTITCTKANLVSGGNILAQYTFNGWYTGNASYSVRKTQVSYQEGNETVYARWSETVKGYSINYVTNNAQNNALNPTYVSVNDNSQNNPKDSQQITIYDPQQRATVGYHKYKFIGWYATYSGQSDGSSDVWDDALYNRYAERYYYIKISNNEYELDEGPYDSNTTYYERKPVSGTNNQYTYTAITFYTEQSITLTINENKTYHALWVELPQPYYIIYHLNGGTNSTANSATVIPSDDPDYDAEDPYAERGSHITNFTISAPEGKAPTIENGITYRYQFAGWFTTSNFTANSDVSVAMTSDLEIYAKWVPHRVYAVTIHRNEGQDQDGYDNVTSYSISDGVVELYDPIRLSNDSRIEFNFKGWFIGSDAAAGTFENEYLITQLDSNIEASLNVLKADYDPDGNGTIDIYAYWEQKPDTYLITYVLGAGEKNSNKNPAYISTLNNARLLAAPSKITYDYSNYPTSIGITTYAFIGWFDAAVGGTQYTTLYYSMHELTLYPHWGASSTYTFYPSTPKRVTHELVADNSGGYFLYGLAPQTEIVSPVNPSASYLVQYSGKYYRMEPVLWAIMSSNGNSYTLFSEYILDCATRDNVLSSTVLSNVSESKSLPTLAQVEQFANNEVLLVATATDYAVAKGAKLDEKMGTAGYWLNDEKPLSEIALDDTTRAQMELEGMAFYKYVSARGELGYMVKTNTHTGYVPVITITV